MMHHGLVDVDAAHRGQSRFGERAPNQFDQLVSAILGVMVAFQRWGRRTQHDRDAALAGAKDRHIARRVRRLSCCLNELSCSSSTMIKASLGNSANTDRRVPDDLRIAELRLSPVIQTLAFAQAAMQANQIHIGKTAAEIILQLRSEIDLRHQQQHRPPRCNTSCIR